MFSEKTPMKDPVPSSGPRITHVKRFVQELSGILGGMVADDDINEAELLNGSAAFRVGPFLA